MSRGPAPDLVAGVVLAAGPARRFGENKLLTWLGDVSVVVPGRDADEVSRALDEMPVRFVVNRRDADGMSTSLRADVEARSPAPARALVALAEAHAEAVAFDFPPPPDIDTPDDLEALRQRLSG